MGRAGPFAGGTPDAASGAGTAPATLRDSAPSWLVPGVGVWARSAGERGARPRVARGLGQVRGASAPCSRPPAPRPGRRARPAPAPAPVRGQPGAGPAAAAGERRAGHGPAAGGGGRLRVAEGARRARRCARSQRGPSPRLQRPGPAAAEQAAISAPHCARPSGRRCPGAMR